MENNRNIIRMLTLVTQFGIHMLVPIFLCFFLGVFLDRKLGTSFIAIILFFIGALAGFRNVYILAKKMEESNSGSGRHGRRGKK